ncbi:MAG: phosphate acyltransferase PlsX [Angelakisella sp.]
MTRIIVDAFGGDHAPTEIIKGARLATDELGVQVILTGDKAKLEAAAKDCGVSLDGIELVHAPDVIPVDEEPTKLLRQYKNCSMAVGFALLVEGRGDAFVSAGSTGALAVGATFIAKRIHGIKRAAIAACIPNEKGVYLLADSGANTECRPEMLRQFAIMGSIYMNKVHGIENPRVGLVNIGTEETKGSDLQIETNKLLRSTKLHYIGNLEARDLPLGGCDVAICDGFTGNIILKLTEGMGKMMKNQLKEMFLANLVSKLGAVMVAGQLKAFKAKFDYKEHGGAMLLGVKKPVIKAHGSSDARAIKNAIRQAKICHESGIIPTIEQAMAAFVDETTGTDSAD